MFSHCACGVAEVKCSVIVLVELLKRSVSHCACGVAESACGVGEAKSQSLCLWSY